MTTNNRRLCVFKELDLLEMCLTVPVNAGDSMPEARRTTRNGGLSIIVRGNPGKNGTRNMKTGTIARLFRFQQGMMTAIRITTTYIVITPTTMTTTVMNADMKCLTVE
ncbi:hypothetical protein DPMN_111367 [Dreissena polymorpha]|uniref:Uncharacterized protein n=1 Tax=Dreissena polymorpha TaxID=45954 RepID=A0A9D4QPQ5_DREPO|nr:hypothetical protein DPMN_111367 [Dreissena polymorpha]